MTGKAYTLHEMKGIVDYLVEHNAYGDVKARKMWIDFANSKLTNRTWQSLKETFLKRILPDIHNPYYKLTVDEIRSFRQGLDVTNKDVNKLEIITLSGENSNSDDKNDCEKPSTSKPAEEASTGEALNVSKVQRDRSSVDTLILEKSYETVEAIQKDLESDVDKEENHKTNNKSSLKSSRDCIMYSEPLTPMMQDLLNDFATDESSDKEPQLEIIEISDTNKDQQTGTNTELEQNTENVENNAIVTASEVVEVLLDTENQDTTIHETDNQQQLITKSQSIENKPLTLKKTKKPEKIEETSKEVEIETLELDKNEVNEINKVKESADDVTTKHKKTDKTSQNTPNSTTDSLLPNNQEALPNSAIVVNADKSVECLKVVPMNEENLLKTNIDGAVSKSLISPNKSNTEKEQTESTSINQDHSYLSANQSPSEIPPNTTSNTNAIENNESNKNIAVDSSQLNPCLQSVSLYDEQFVTVETSDSDSNIDEQNIKSNVKVIDKLPSHGEKHNMNDKPRASITKDVNQVKKIAINVEKEFVVLKSHSEESDNAQPNKRSQVKRLVNSDKNKALANLFGFTSGAVSSPRKRQMTKRQSHRYSHMRVTSESSEWTSESDDEYVSPPKGRKNKYTKKYLKPHSARVLSLEEEGGLFVIHGKKIYPLIKDGKILKNYLTYLPESDHEEDKSFWKAKYDEEKKKTEELSKLLESTKRDVDRTISPILQMTSHPKPIAQVANKQNDGIIDLAENRLQNVTESKPEVRQENTESVKTVKIKFTKKNSEVQIEGHWSQLNPVLDHFVQIYNSEPAGEVKIPSLPESRSASVSTRTSVETNHSGKNTQAIEEQVDMIETEIFNEIEEMDKKKENDYEQTRNDNTQQSLNVTLRKRNRAEPTPTKQSPQNTAKKPKVDEVTESLSTVLSTSKRASRAKEKPNKSKISITKTRQSRKKQLEGDTHMTEDSTVRYKLPSPKSSANLNQKDTSSNKRYPQNRKQPVSSPDNFTQNSMESTQGYQDSDVSLTKNRNRRKKRLSSSIILFRERTRLNRRKTRSYSSMQNITVEPRNSFNNLLVKPNNSSLNTDIYKSESYKILMGQSKIVSKPLDKIDEHALLNRNDTNQTTDFTVSPNYWLGQELSKASKENNANSSGGGSNVSLPQSPELSIVENISFNKDDVQCKINYPTLNETICKDMTENGTGNKYIISKVDVSVPLMGQECKIQERQNLNSSPISLRDSQYDFRLNAQSPTVTESLLNKIGTVDIEDQSDADSLGTELRNLILESAKKKSKTNETENMEIEHNTQTKKAKTKKRCSTPRKRKSVTKKSVVPNVDTVIEERMEFCSQGSAQSCPPYQLFNRVDIVGDKEKKQALKTNVKPKKSKKKDVIKVKITKPKNKKNKSKASKDNSDKYDESGVFFNDNESVDLIHNHSETCLNAKECVEDSVEFISMLSKSIISVNSNSCDHERRFTTFDTPRAETFCCDGLKDKSEFGDSPGQISFSSLITEDLSDELKQDFGSKWYLLSDDDNNTLEANPSMGSRLDQIFPVTCAVPNLSIITEISKDTDQNSRLKLEK